MVCSLLCERYLSACGCGGCMPCMGVCYVVGMHVGICILCVVCGVRGVS